MSKTPVANTVNINPNLLSFKPRQVLLLSNRSPTMKQENNSTKSQTLKPEQKAVLLHSIANYLEKAGGFSKTLKKFKSESKHEKEDLDGGSLIDLEEVFCKFLKTSDNTCKKLESSQVQDIQMNDFTKKKKKGDTDAINKKLGAADKVNNYENVEEILTSDTVSTEVKPKEKKKKNKNSDSHGQEEQYNTEALKEPADNVAGESPEKKHKDKKKKKKSSLESESQVDNGGHYPSEPVATEEKSKDVAPSEGNNVAVSETEKKTKDKKKKKNKLSDVDADSIDNKNVKSEGRKKRKDIVVTENISVETLDEGTSNKVDSEKDDSKNSKEDVNDTEDKKSKKRKRLPSEDDAPQPADEKAVEDSKRRKMESSEEPKENGQANGNLEENGEKSSLQKSMKKEKNGSVEPKTVKHFQRVKVEEVVFSDERLKDNSYWAKAGAEDGYGAKAQDILGQVRGRDFRHEKTKKKRGTYRGGQIDLQSHSVKFNYSDED